ncbi:MAG: sulfotransferase [Acidobacteriota bacterium]
MTSTHAAHVFLHGFWRSGSTWLWSKFRHRPEVLALYEPFNEGLAHPHVIVDVEAESWSSNHPELAAPYFDEYRTIPRDASRPWTYRESLALDLYFDDDAHGPSEAWIARLLEAAEVREQRAALGFCRSLARLPALRRAFPEAHHLWLLRDPLQTFASMWHQHRRGNAYFLAMLGLIAQLHAERPPLGHAIAALGPIDLDESPAAPAAFEVRFERAGRWVAQRTATECLVLFLAVFRESASARHLGATDGIVLDELLDPVVRRRVERGLAQRLGLPIDLSDVRLPTHALDDLTIDLGAFRDLAERVFQTSDLAQARDLEELQAAAAELLRTRF